ncbi:alpha-1,2-mannosyltransferase Mnn22p [[Candida] jaroonii]|uniref:Alpha-1,2-mannosyltransferase Mnn22p n=1 Tax=[Candida] jaroonii TaxID=467808 RepID=A0ACA9YBS6_9ASCO|nr:alpha-1,2-mannosyltransferase Mnn22p [[Candida] jaroonii]
MHKRIRTRLLVLVFAISILASITYISSCDTYNFPTPVGIIPHSYENSIKYTKPQVGQVKAQPRHIFWDKVFNIFDAGSFNVTGIDKKDAIQYVDRKLQIKGPNTKNVLLSRAIVEPIVFNELKNKHDLVKYHLPKRLESSTYKSGTSGIVIIGGGKFSWLAYLSLKALRNTGSTLPVEIIMPQYDDYIKEQEFCSQALPKLNAQCVILPEVLGASVMSRWSDKMASYQLKSLALMVSTFQNVLLLDSDNVLVQNPDNLFKSDLFKTNGMITWPDYWKRSISPLFYNISRVQVNEKKRIRYNRFPLFVDSSTKENVQTLENEEENVPYHDLEGTIPDLSTESGQLMINKKTHSCTLLLSMYYNLLGPDLYYKLFSLGEPGEGDKDTFPAAAVVCKEKFYQVKSFIRTFGYFDNGGNFRGVAMGQKDPLFDLGKTETHLTKPDGVSEIKFKSIPKQIERLKGIEGEQFDTWPVPLFAIHCNFPKLDPIGLMERDDLFDVKNFRLNYRMFDGLTYDDPNNEGNKLDFELEQWKNMESSLCDEDPGFSHFRKNEIQYYCLFAKSQVKWLSSSV